jgi:hypothetical protein
VCQFDSTRHSKDMKVVELVVMKIMGFVKNERTFNSLTFTKISFTISHVNISNYLFAFMFNKFTLTKTFFYENKASY